MRRNLFNKTIHVIYYASPEWGKRILERAYWKVWLMNLELKIRFRMFRGGIKTFKPHEVVYVNPSEICYWNPTDSNDQYEDMGSVKGGDWDLKGERFEDKDVFVGLREHFENGVPLSRTKVHTRILKEMQEGIPKWGCKTEDELNARWRKIDELYFDIKTRGYKTQRELGNPNYLDEIAVKIGRDGELLLADGQHRLAIAKILGLQSIPVIITKRHYEWAKFKLKLLSRAGMYQPLLHPDLTDIPTGKGEERFDIILNNLPCHSGEVLDIGANWGYFCHKLEDIGFTCYAVENSREQLHFLNKLKSIGKRKFKVISKSVFDIEKLNYDIVLALNIFHHFLKNEDDYRKLTEFLGRLDTKFLFFEPHRFNESQMRAAYMNYNETEFIEYILRNSCLNTYTFLGSLKEDGRALYLLKR